MVSRVILGPDEDGTQYTGSVRTYVRDGDRTGWGMAGEQGLEHAYELREVEGREKRYDVSGELLPPHSVGLVKKPKGLSCLKDLPRKCWTAAKNETR